MPTGPLFDGFRISGIACADRAIVGIDRTVEKARIGERAMRDEAALEFPAALRA